MLTLDGDGNGEVDFDEFLKVWEPLEFSYPNLVENWNEFQIMTDTEMFIEVFVEKNTGETLRCVWYVFIYIYSNVQT